MPPKGYVGIDITPRRKMLLREVMQAESFNKPTEALDFALAFAQRFIKVDAELSGDESTSVPNVPDYINYYIGDPAPLDRSGAAGGLVEHAREKGVGAITHSDWRLDALNTLRNMEATSMTLPDAIDFALTSYLMHARGGTIDGAERDAIKAQVRANAVSYREELTQFRRDNMEQQERDARLDGTKAGKKTAKTKRKRAPSAVDDIIAALGAIKHDDTGIACMVCQKLRNVGIHSDALASMHRMGVLDSTIKYVDANGKRVEREPVDPDAEIPF